MLRLGQFTDTFLPIVDGVGRVVYAYADTLCKMGHQVTVVAPMYDTGFQGGFPFELVDFMGAGLPGMKQYQIGEAVWDPHYRRRMRMIQLDLIHAHSPFTAGSEALRIATLRKLPLVATFHSKYYDDFLKATKSESIARMGTKFVVNFYNRCDEVWAVGKNAADVLKDYGYEGDVIVMPNGATMRTVSPADVEGVSRRWNLGDDPVILFVGQMDWKKNILTILEACAEMKQAGMNFRLLLAGQGVDMNNIDRKIHELNIQDRSQMLGHISDTSLLDALRSLPSPPSTIPLPWWCGKRPSWARRRSWSAAAPRRNTSGTGKTASSARTTRRTLPACSPAPCRSRISSRRQEKRHGKPFPCPGIKSWRMPWSGTPASSPSVRRVP